MGALLRLCRWLGRLRDARYHAFADCGPTRDGYRPRARCCADGCCRLQFPHHDEPHSRHGERVLLYQAAFRLRPFLPLYLGHGPCLPGGAVGEHVGLRADCPLSSWTRTAKGLQLYHHGLRGLGRRAVYHACNYTSVRVHQLQEHQRTAPGEHGACSHILWRCGQPVCNYCLQGRD